MLAHSLNSVNSEEAVAKLNNQFQQAISLIRLESIWWASELKYNFQLWFFGLEKFCKSIKRSCDNALWTSLLIRCLQSNKWWGVCKLAFKKYKTKRNWSQVHSYRFGNSIGPKVNGPSKVNAIICEVLIVYFNQVSDRHIISIVNPRTEIFFKPAEAWWK